jgi:hypothetical protein
LWKDGNFSKLSTAKELFQQKTREKNINVGMELATKLLGELQENEIASFLLWARALSKPDQEALSEMPPFVNAAQNPPHLPPTTFVDSRGTRSKCRHHDKSSTRTSRGKASNG